jgi:RHS repeat-associated protein
LLDANGNAQWREITLVSANGEPNDWRHQQLNGFVIPTLYKADGSGIPVDKATIHIYPAVGHGFQPTLFDDLRVSISRANEQESYFMAVIEESHDYHEFGMEMAGRGFSGSYRFGYQGSEKDNEVSGDGNSYTTEFRQLDPRLGRWFSVDPWEQKYPYISPYASMHNNPINLTDVRGLGPKNAKDKLVSSYQENTVIYNLYKSQDGKFYVEIADPNYVKSTYVEAEHFNGNVGEAYEYLANNTREFKQAYATQKANDEAKESKDAELKAQKLRDEEKALKKKEYIEKMSRIHQAEYGATGDSELDEARQEPTAKRLRKQAPKTYHAGDKDFFDVKPYWTAGDLGKVMLEKGKVVGMGGKSFYTAIKKAQVFRLNVSEINEAAVKHQVRGILRTLGAGNSFIIPYQDSQGKVTGYWYIEVKVDAKGNEVLIEKDEPRILIETQDVNKT